MSKPERSVAPAGSPPPFPTPSSTDSPFPPGRLRQPLWWRCYSSDLSRALETARTVLHEAQQLSQSSCTDMPRLEDIRVDRRLRERAYGARELCRRDMSYSECVERWVSIDNRNHAATTSSGVRTGKTATEEAEKGIPPLETEDDVWKRAESFLRDLFAELATEPVPGSGDVHDADAAERNVLIVSHAGCIRQIFFPFGGRGGLAKAPQCGIRVRS
jgi:broad specificity phosphatase PhoE